MDPQEAALQHRLRGKTLTGNELRQHCGRRRSGDGAPCDGVNRVWEVKEGDGRVGRVYFLIFGLEESGNDGAK